MVFSLFCIFIYSSMAKESVQTLMIDFCINIHSTIAMLSMHFLIFFILFTATSKQIYFMLILVIPISSYPLD